MIAMILAVLVFLSHAVQFLDWRFDLEAAAFVGLQVWDVLSTNAFLAAGIPEAGPIAKRAQALLGRNWWVVKIPEIAVVYVAACYPPIGARMMLGMLCMIYLINNLRNGER